MAINVNKVYRVVLSILNKEQRGYLTPDQFNRLGRQAQLDLFEKSFYDYNRQLTKRNVQGVNSEYGDIADNIEEKIDLFAKSAGLTLVSSGTYSAPADLYRTIQITTSNGLTEIEKIKKSEYSYYSSSQLSAPSTSYPVYYFDNNVFKVFPSSISSPVINYIRIPADPIWGYTVPGVGETNAGAYIYASGASTDFELHPSDETDLVIKILAYAGVVIKDPTVIQVAQQQEANNVTLENS
jgi:hypothetical protein